MPLLVDTYNVLHVTGVLPPELAGMEVADLVDLISVSRYARRSTCLVCDGNPPPDAPEGDFGSIRVVYAGASRTADSLILTMISRSSAPRRLVLVTLDRALQQAASRQKAHVLGSDAFLKRLAADATRARRTGKKPALRKPSDRLSPGEVDRWLRVFGLIDRPGAAGLHRGRNSPDERVLDELDHLDMDDLLRDI